MKNLRKLREASGYTQGVLAEMLKTTQQTIARWETGKAEPNVAALKDLAMIFGTSVDDLVGRNPISSKLTTTRYTLFTKGDQDGYWGNVGLLLPSEERTRWYPITIGELRRISAALNADYDWISFSTLNNRMVVFNRDRVRRVWLLDEACDPPEGDWTVGWDSVEGFPLEFYRALNDCLHDADEFRASTSETLITIVEKQIAENKWSEDDIRRLTEDTRVWLVTGEQVCYAVEPEQLWDVVYAVDSEDLGRMIRLEAFGGGFDTYLPRERVVSIEMPLLTVMGAAKDALEEVEA